MCTCQPVAYHHVPPCTRPALQSMRCDYCPRAIRNPVTGLVVSTCGYVSPQQAPRAGGDRCPKCRDMDDPNCASGFCRLEDLGRRWVCCRCRRGGNDFVYCLNKKKGSPDTFCYHRVCAGCTKDTAT